MSEKLILVLDEGTSSTRAILFTRMGGVFDCAQMDITQHYPQAGWVEHDAGEIWQKTRACAEKMVKKAGGADRIAAIGIANQRETIVAWDKVSGEPLARAIVWQDRRTAEHCAALQDAGEENWVRAKTGLLLDPYFSASKMAWLLNNDRAVAGAAQAGALAFGTVESWLIFKLSGAHISDAGNASRTMLLGLEAATWGEDLCELFAIPRDALPQICDSAIDGPKTHIGLFGGAIPICGLAGDQQAATIGQGCLNIGQTKATYGTGAFILTHQGSAPVHSQNRLLSTVLCQIDGRRSFALEGSIFTAGSLLQWLRDGLGLIDHSQECEALARSVPDNGGVCLVPALSGLGAPWWRPDARGVISGLSFASGKAHIARAALEAMAHQTHDLAEAFAADGAAWNSLKIDGGMAGNDWVAQDIADVLGLSVTRPDNVETTALGAAMLAAIGCGIYANLEEAAAHMIGGGRAFSPQMDDSVRAGRLSHWAQALERV